MVRKNVFYCTYWSSCSFNLTFPLLLNFLLTHDCPVWFELVQVCMYEHFVINQLELYKPNAILLHFVHSELEVHFQEAKKEMAKECQYVHLCICRCICTLVCVQPYVWPAMATSVCHVST